MITSLQKQMFLLLFFFFISSITFKRKCKECYILFLHLFLQKNVLDQ